MITNETVLVVGELIVDYTIGKNGQKCKLRLGGVAHAARGLWAANISYSLAAFCPKYLVDEAKAFLSKHDCIDFIWLGDIIGAPNIVIIDDVAEIADQGYDDLMRETKVFVYNESLPELNSYNKVVVFPGGYDLNFIGKQFSDTTEFFIDIAYDVVSLSDLKPFMGRLGAVLISTSSVLFKELGGNNLNDLLVKLKEIKVKVFLLKENRGGSRLFDICNDSVEEIPARLTNTVNSVGVGDVYSSVMAALSDKGWKEAAWRGYQCATIYAGSTFPDDIKRDIQRALKTSLSELISTGGTILPWHARQTYSIYIAGPDFSYIEKPEFDKAIASLEYHNFKICRPILENGELTLPAKDAEVLHTYQMDCDLLESCDIVFAIPLNRDPGTLVEIGMGIEMKKPIITFDPRNENNNTMVMAGSYIYSNNLDDCLRGVFESISDIRKKYR